MCNRATQNSIFMPVLNIQYMLLFVGFLYMSRILKHFKMSAVTDGGPGVMREGGSGHGSNLGYIWDVCVCV